MATRIPSATPRGTPFLSTPPYPEYSSGANCLSGAMVTTLQLFFGTDEFDFSVSSPTPGLTTNPRLYQRFSDAAQEMVDVRILQGIHFRSADDEGRRQGSPLLSLDGAALEHHAPAWACRGTFDQRQP